MIYNTKWNMQTIAVGSLLTKCNTIFFSGFLCDSCLLIISHLEVQNVYQTISGALFVWDQDKTEYKCGWFGCKTKTFKYSNQILQVYWPKVRISQPLFYWVRNSNASLSSTFSYNKTKASPVVSANRAVWFQVAIVCSLVCDSILN